MRVDYHVHTMFSVDSEAKPEEYLTSAKDKGVDLLCFTEHVDFNPNDDGFGYYRPEKFFEKMNSLKKEAAASSVKVMTGIEFSEPHLYAEELKKLTGSYPYDFVIGSIHFVGDLFPCHEVRKRYSTKEFFTMYWKEVLAAVTAGGFDCLGHIDFPKRYYQELYYSETEMKEVMERLVDREIILEINTSSLRKGLTETMPGKEMLSLYQRAGGRFVTIGSDAHTAGDLSADNEAGKQLIRELGLTEVIFKERRRIPLNQVNLT